ncbi:MAG: immunoglobulin-like domain-containing protein, partial [Actinomycetota bacterium]
MYTTKTRFSVKILVFFLIISLVFWLMPANLVFAQEEDTAPPVITLIGKSSIEVELDSIYEDPGATASDDVDGDITDS